MIKMRKILYIACLTIMGAIFFAGCGKNVVIESYSIIPEPVLLTMGNEKFVFSTKTSCYVENVGQNDPSIKYILKTLRQWHFNPSLVGKPEENCLQFVINSTANTELGDEGYTIDIEKNGITIKANTEKGLFYGFQTFVQMLPEDISTVRYRKIEMQTCSVKDYPRFKWRGTLLDVSRHFFGVNQVKKHIDLMASYKMNKLHMHLTDDHGWRVEIKKYPQLNDVGSWRVDRDNQPWGKADPAGKGEPRSYGGYYSKSEIEEIVKYAAERNIDVIPEIEIPGHCCAVLEAYPNFACEGDDTTYTVQFGPYWPPRAILCGGNDSVMTFLKDVLDEIIPLFPSEYIHIGGDEAVKDNWKRCPRCQARISSLGLKDEEELQSWMIMEIEKYLNRLGKKIIGWDEILDGGVSNEATVMSWRGAEGGIAAARRGNDVIMSPLEYCYLNFYQANYQFQPPAMPNSLVTLYKVYGFNPVPDGLTDIQSKHILGGQANLWTEYINNYETAEYMLLPRLCAMAEVLWSPLNVKDWHHFRNKMVSHRKRLEACEYHVGASSYKPWAVSEKLDGGKVKVTLDWEVEGMRVYYSVGGSAYKLYNGPFEATEGTTITTVSFLGGIMKEKPYELKIENK